MARNEQQPEPGGKNLNFNQPYAAGLKRLLEDVLAKTDFDPAVLWQWGTMQARVLTGILKKCEERFGQEGRELVYEAAYEEGFNVGSQILEGIEIPNDMPHAVFSNYLATMINRVAYASPNVPKIDSEDRLSLNILWCPHEDIHEGLDCRVQCVFVQGIIDAAREYTEKLGLEMRFNPTIPAGAPPCHFTRWQREEGQPKAWPDCADFISEKPPQHTEERRVAKEEQ